MMLKVRKLRGLVIEIGEHAIISEDVVSAVVAIAILTLRS